MKFTPFSRLFCAASLAFLSSCSTGEPFAAQGGASNGSGCLRQTVDACLAKLRPFTSVSSYNFALQSVVSNRRTDVNGKRLYTDNTVAVSLNSNDPYGVEHGIITLKYSNSNEITEILFRPSGGIYYAKTDDDYAKTGIYEGALLAIGQRCDILASPQAFHKFFHNSVRAKMGPMETTANVSEIHAERTHLKETKWVDLCGAQILYSEMSGYDTNNIDAHNATGIFAYYTLHFK